MVLSQQKLSIVKATRKDLPDIAKLSIEMLKYHNTLSNDYFTIFPYEKYLAGFEEKLKNDQYILVAKIGNKVVGFLSAKFKNTPWYKNANVCIIDEIVVAKECRSCGVGTTLFQKLLAVCKEKKNRRNQIGCLQYQCTSKATL